MIAPRILRDSFRYVYLSNSSLFFCFFGKRILEMHSQVQTRLRTRPLQGWECSSVGEHLPNMPGHNSVLTSKQGKAKHQLSTEIKRVVWLIWCRASIHSGTALTPLKVVQKQGAMYAKDKSPTQQCSCVHVTNENKK